ncbi:MAG: hypothetical protein A3D52_00150 [Candidatus Taylorbacteria bacterium RIFCSPHIGHO2_02_FULL_44_36]|uniref:Uncharacterized protein n=1 Tax=Candidatus Taylorbacteria bacterium RIFCSPLOWO2_12_FULL_44_15c TaxID=1802333 RepID=A0A1G2P492_9BACT|nr:MAG: hypothetical protein A3D52_00150 [Candidatus Taylorbacteria bacterium RIFCSPHIGHO2_02_FULL_44_36]OHA38151.1 MAG: hypothetical protein A3I97_01935 [Candidatus Taylorbacteria bacterium RIFCSPLOWO2_02_FULL_44_35]OHA43146.1 MAG: hypothetical protein A3G03_00285 [Candidatus Taylorbacteria bacterium RIFCSPLOWO2_12_FULL_44_15c]
MFKPKTILLLGIWLISIPFFGIPTSWRSLLLYATGFILIANYFLRKKTVAPVETEHSKDAGAGATFVENGQQ